MRDLVLVSLARAANEGEASDVGISLLVGGSWLTGRLVGARVWFRALSRLVEEQGGEGMATFGPDLAKVGELLYPSESEVAVGLAEAQGDELPWFVHLVDARLLDPSGAVPEPGGLVRVRIDAVAGWLLGEVTSE